MKNTTSRFQSDTDALSSPNPSMPAPLNIARTLERLELLVPELALTTPTTHATNATHSGSRNLQEYALAYVERYRGDVLQLEHEWEVLYVALMQAWRKAEYAVVVRLVAGLAHSIGRMSKLEEAEHILHMGIDASRHTQDKTRLAYFLNRLGNLLFAYGQYAQGRRVWHSSLQLAEASGRRQASPLRELLEPLSSFAHMADILGNYTAVQHFVETLQHASQGNDPITLAVAIFIRAFHARHVFDLDRAYDDLCYSLRLLASQPVDSSLSSHRQLFTIVIQIELARVQGDYDRSQIYTETALALAQLFADRYTAAALILDQQQFAHQLGRQAYVPSILLRPANGPQPIGTLHIYERHRSAEQYVAQTTQVYDGVTVTLEPPHLSTMPTLTEMEPGSLVRSIEPEKLIELIEPMSEREREVLQLVAIGLSNREIACRLVITPGTVKKHLEHIYSKLNVHNRTAAIARARMLKIFS